MNTAVSRRKILRKAVAPIIENLESRQYFTAIVANFDGGNGTSQVDQYAGQGGDGWWAGWNTSSSNTDISASVVNTSPLNGGGNYVSATMTADGGSSRGSIARGYNTTGNIDVTELHQVQLDFRLDSSMSTFTSNNDRVYVFGDTGYRLAPLDDDTMLAEARGAAMTGLAAQHWGLIDGDGNGDGSYVDTGITLTQGTVYHFTFLIDSANHQYQGTITDGQAGAGHTYSSGWLGFDYDSDFSSRAYLNIGSRRSGSTESTTFSFDNVLVSPPPPDAPTNFAATTDGTTPTSKINLSWTDNAVTETGYVLEWSTASDFSTITGSSTPATNATSASVSGLAAGTTYYFRLKTLNEGGESTYATDSEATTGGSPLAPTGLTVTTFFHDEINVSWTDNASNETGFTLEWSTDSGFATIAGSANYNANVTSGSATSLLAATPYYLRVKATNGSGSSTYATTSQTTSSGVPTAPSGLSATAVSPTQIDLTWTDNSSTETGFEIEYATDSSFTQNVGTGTATIDAIGTSITGLASATTYYFRVRATGFVGNSAYSASDSDTTQGTAINAPIDLAVLRVEGRGIELYWTDDSGNETGFTIYQAVGGSTNFIPVATVAAGTFRYMAENLDPDTPYSFRVAATGSGGSQSMPSNTVNPTTSAHDEARVFRASLVSPSLTMGSAGATSTGTITLKNSGWISASSATSAAIQEIASATVNNGFDSQTYQFTSQNITERFQIMDSIPGVVGPTEGVVYLGFEDGADSDYNDAYFAIRVDSQVEDCGCDECEGLAAAGSDGNQAAAQVKGAGSVNMATGVVTESISELFSGGFGSDWGITRGWTNSATTGSSNTAGAGNVIAQLPSIRSTSDGILVTLNSGASKYYTFNGSAYVAQLADQKETLVVGSNSDLVFTDTVGNRTYFQDFTVAADLQGKFKSYVDADGSVVTVKSYDDNGNIKEIIRSQGSGSTAQIESFVYAYQDGGVNDKLLTSVTLRRGTGDPTDGDYPNNVTDWTTVRTVGYTYYDGSDANGSARDLKLAEVKDAAGNVLDTQYYRYYKLGDADGYSRGLKYSFGTAAYARLLAAGLSTSSSDTAIATYADHHYKYDQFRRVIEHTAQGEGCSSCSGGQGTYTYTYTASANPTDYNKWATKTVETLPDGSQNIVYANGYGQVMLKVFIDANGTPGNGADDKEYRDFYAYDDAGRLILHANPSAVTDYDDSYADLLNEVSGNYQYLADTSGLIELTDYGTSTTATGTDLSSDGDVLGYEKGMSIKQGETATAVAQTAYTYYKRTSNSIVTYVIATETQFRETNGTGAQETQYSYVWYGDDTTGTTADDVPQIKSQTVTLPAVTTAQNGPNVSSSTIYVFDNYGRTVWTKDGDGYLTYSEYDDETGAVTQFIKDADPSAISSPSVTAPSRGSGLPTALHLVTTYVLDSLGRTTKETDPNGNVTYTIYDDVNDEYRIYRGWNATTGATTGPIEVYREDRPGSYSEFLTMSATPTKSGSSGSYVPTGEEVISNLQSLNRTFTSAGGQVVETREYFDLSGLTYTTSATLGTASNDTGAPTGNFHSITYAYDQRGRLKRTQSPTGTITWTLYDGLGRTTSTWLGTDDTDAVNGDPTGGGATGNNMIKVAEYEYDNGGIGDGNLTKITQIPGGSAPNRVTEMYYDWRNRQVATKAAVEASESTGDNTHFISYTDYDNLNQATASYVYDGDNVSVSTSNGVPQAPSASLLRAKQTSEYDEQGRVFRSTTYSVDSSNGLVSNTFYDHRGNMIKSSQPGGLVNKMVYDGAGRMTKSYSTDGGGDSTWSDADDVTGDNVLEQAETQYDAAGNVILNTTRQRFHNETDTGELGTPTTGVNARVSYQAMYYDAANRLTSVADVGTNGGSSYTRPGSVDARSDTNLVTSYTYDAAGNMQDVTDPKGIVSRTLHDALGRTTKTIANYVDGTPSDADDQTTSYTYDGNGNVLTLKAELPSSTFQETKYIYQARTTTGSDINSNDILTAVQYPDLTSGSASSGQQETLTVNALGQTTTKADRNGTVHTYSYDVLGRQSADAVTTLGSGVDGAIRRLTTEYDTQGNAYRFTSYDASSAGNVVNQVQREFNGLGQLITEYQAVNGAVNTSTTPKVQYGYSEMASSANHSRLTSMTYPSGRVISYNYASGLNDSISRLTSLSDTSITLESLTYLGLGTVVERNHPQSGYNINLTYIGTPGDAGDQYAGLDRFGRVINQNWVDADNSNASVDRYTYGYDRNGNRLYKENTLSASNSELYAYDNLNRLTTMQRGTLNSGKTALTGSATRSQAWDLDALGNSDSVTTDSVTENRTHNQQNQLTGMGSSTLAFDTNGNTTTDQTGKTLSHDAWNRLVEVKNGSASLIRYERDALSRRIEEGGAALYYSAGWQVLEERVSDVTVMQHVWSPVYVDAAIARDRDTDANGTLDERLYVIQDANFNVTSLANTSGIVVERYLSDAYGKQIVLDANWVIDGDGLSDVNNRQGHQGGFHDRVVTYHIDFRNRFLDVDTMRWGQQDALGYADGLALYSYEQSQPITHLDQFGLQTQPAASFTANLKPTTENSMGYYIGIIADAATQGYTVSTFSATVGCECGSDNRWRMTGKIDFEANVVLSAALSTPGALDDTYGHEQRHVQNQLKRVKEIIALSNSGPGKLVFDSLAECGESAWALQQTMTRNLEQMVQDEIDHKNPVPVKGTSVKYPVIGTRPPKPNTGTTIPRPTPVPPRPVNVE